MDESQITAVQKQVGPALDPQWKEVVLRHGKSFMGQHSPSANGEYINRWCPWHSKRRRPSLLPRLLLCCYCLEDAGGARYNSFWPLFYLKRFCGRSRQPVICHTCHKPTTCHKPCHKFCHNGYHKFEPYHKILPHAFTTKKGVGLKNLKNFKIKLDFFDIPIISFWYTMTLASYDYLHYINRIMLIKSLVIVRCHT